MKNLPRVLLVLLLGALRAQESFVLDPMSAAELRTTLEFLTADERGGRDSPSPGLTQARDYLVDRARRAGLLPGVGDSFLHRYTLPGARIDGRKLGLTVHATDGSSTTLVPEQDVRLWRVDGEFIKPDVEVLRLSLEQEGVDRLFQRQRGQRLVLVEVETSGALWSVCGGARERLFRDRAGGPPWVVVRKGVLPAGDLRADVDLPAPEPVDVELSNVVAVLRAEGAKEWVLFSAHYDHVGIGMPRNGDPIYNGADDNATGSAAVLALAEAFAAQKPALARNLAFVWFSAEEKGLRGSRAFVEAPPIPLADMAAVINLEMLGRPPEQGPRHAWITGSDLSDLAAIAAPVLAKADVTLVPFAMAGPLFSGSDNLPFAQKGVVAHSLSAGSLHADYHQPSDELALLDVDHTSSVVRALYALGVEFATRADRPSYNAKGKKQLKLE